MPTEDAVSRSLSGADVPSEDVSLALLAKARAGDESALCELLERYQERLHRIVSIQLGDSPIRRVHDSLDVLQHTLAAAVPKIGEFRPRSSSGLLRWLATIATNHICDAYAHHHAGKRDLRRAVRLDGPTAGDMSRIDIAGPSRADPARAVELDELTRIVDDAVRALPDDQRQVVLLRDYCGESWENVAREMAREPGAARQLHQRAKIRLRRALRPYVTDPSGGDTAP